MNKTLLNKGWTFRKIDGGMENDRKSVCLPYDAMIRERRIPDLVGGETSAYYPGGIYEYERTFFLPETGAETTFLEFEGIWQKAEILIDDVPTATHINGYTGFFVELPERISRGENHFLKVIADNSQIPNSRWYTGSGIYRDVYLHTGSNISILPGTVKIKTISLEPAVIEVSWKLSAVIQGLMKIVISRNSVPIIEENAKLENGITSITIPDPKYWSDSTPTLYSISLTAFSQDGCVCDSTEETFGIRKIEWGGQNCLAINGKEVKLRGACIHHDNGLIGSSEFCESAYRRIRTLKECGYNAVRSAHNPASTWILKACDEIGMYVMDEFSDVWRGAKKPFNRESWTTQPYIGNCVYQPGDNSFTITAAFTQAPNFREDMSDEELYAYMGTGIAHEISHAFDAQGAQYDKDGNFINWWTDEDYAAFNEKNKKLAAYFNGMHPWEGQDFNGEAMVGEACADMTALKCILRIAAGKPDFDYDKFFRAYADRCASKEPLTWATVLLQDEHLWVICVSIQICSSMTNSWISTVLPKETICIWLRKTALRSGDRGTGTKTIRK